MSSLPANPSTSCIYSLLPRYILFLPWCPLVLPRCSPILLRCYEMPPFFCADTLLFCPDPLVFCPDALLFCQDILLFCQVPSYFAQMPPFSVHFCFLPSPPHSWGFSEVFSMDPHLPHTTPLACRGCYALGFLPLPLPVPVFSWRKVLAAGAGMSAFSKSSLYAANVIDSCICIAV